MGFKATKNAFNLSLCLFYKLEHLPCLGVMKAEPEKGRREPEVTSWPPVNIPAGTND